MSKRHTWLMFLVKRPRPEMPGTLEEDYARQERIAREIWFRSERQERLAKNAFERGQTGTPLSKN